VSTKFTDSTLYGEVVEPIIMAYIDFPTANAEQKYMHTGLGIIDALGQQWFGIGDLGTISTPKESIDLKPTRVSVTVSPVVRDVLYDVLNSDIKGRTAELYVAFLDEEGAIAGGPHILVKGTLGAPKVTYGDESSIAIEIIDFRESLKSKNGKRFSLQDHQDDYPGDLFYEFLAVMEDFTFTFMGKAIQAGPSVGPGYGGGGEYGDYTEPFYQDQF
jgi:hypothetical protein